MTEFAVFNEWIAQELVERGFYLVGRSSLAWFFEDSVLLEKAVSELAAALVDNGQ